MEKLIRTKEIGDKEVIDPEFFTVDLSLFEGMENRILRRLKRGETLAEMYAELYNSLDEIEGVGLNSIEFHRTVARGLALVEFMATEYMELKGWKFNDENHTVERPSELDKAGGNVEAVKN